MSIPPIDLVQNAIGDMKIDPAEYGIEVEVETSVYLDKEERVEAQVVMLQGPNETYLQILSTNPNNDDLADKFYVRGRGASQRILQSYSDVITTVTNWVRHVAA